MLQGQPTLFCAFGAWCGCGPPGRRQRFLRFRLVHGIVICFTGTHSNRWLMSTKRSTKSLEIKQRGRLGAYKHHGQAAQVLTLRFSEPPRGTIEELAVGINLFHSCIQHHIASMSRPKEVVCRCVWMNWVLSDVE